jgi:O-antigen/teichoic acid export membrane protein
VSQARRIGENMVSAVIGKAIVAVAGMLTVAIMAHHLGADGYGIIRIALTFVSFAAILANLGLNYIMLREVATDEVNSTRLIGAALSLRLLATVTVLAAGVGVAALTRWSSTVVAAVAIASFGMLAYQGNELVTCALQWRLRQGRAAMAEVVGGVVALAGAVIVSRAGGGVLAMTWASSAGLMVTFLLAWTLAGRLGPVRPVIDTRLWWRMIRPGLPIAASACLELFTLRGDTLMLSVFQPARDVGLYGIATKIYEVGLQLPVLFGGLMMPFFSRLAHDQLQLRRYVAQSLHVLVVVGVGIVLTMGLFASDIVVLIGGAGFAAAAPAVRIAGVSLALAGCSAILRYAAVAQGRQRELLLVDGATAALALAAYLALIPRWSFIGAAVATLIAEIFNLVNVFLVVRRGAGAAPWPSLAPRALLAGGLAAIAIALLRWSSLPTFIVAVLGALIYGALLLLTGAMSLSTVQTLLARAERG